MITEAIEDTYFPKCYAIDNKIYNCILNARLSLFYNIMLQIVKQM